VHPSSGVAIAPPPLPRPHDAVFSATSHFSTMADTENSRRSINQILREHPRERLFVWTICWTARHLELLGCTFVDDDDNHGDEPATGRGPGKPEGPLTPPGDIEESLKCTGKPDATDPGCRDNNNNNNNNNPQADITPPAEIDTTADREWASYLEHAAKGIITTGQEQVCARAMNKLLNASADQYIRVE
jgi:hypothetical protein